MGVKVLYANNDIVDYFLGVLFEPHHVIKRMRVGFISPFSDSV